MKEFKIGNTTIKFNGSKAVQTEEEKKAILDEAAAVATRSIVDAELKKIQSTA